MQIRDTELGDSDDRDRGGDDDGYDDDGEGKVTHWSPPGGDSVKLLNLFYYVCLLHVSVGGGGGTIFVI